MSQTVNLNICIAFPKLKAWSQVTTEIRRLESVVSSAKPDKWHINYVKELEMPKFAILNIKNWKIRFNHFELKLCQILLN